jgi:hypothetical protein
MHILNEGQPEYEYEALALAVLGGKYKYDEPFGIAATDFYDHEVADASLKGKRALSIILAKMIFDNKTSKLASKIVELDDRIWSDLRPENAALIVKEIITMATVLGY